MYDLGWYDRYIHKWSILYIYLIFVRVLAMFYSIIRVSMSFTMILNIIELMFSSKMIEIIRDVLVELELIRIAFSDINRFRTKIVLLIKHNKEWWTWIAMKHIYMGHVYLSNMYMNEFNAFIHTKLPRHIKPFRVKSSMKIF